MIVCQCEVLVSFGLFVFYMEVEGFVDVCCVQWLMGKLWFWWCQLVFSQQEQCVFLSKIYLYICGCYSDQSFGYLFVIEVEMFRDLEGGQQLLWILEYENWCLEVVLVWWCVEFVFWQWMDMVLGICVLEVFVVVLQFIFLFWVFECGDGELELVVWELQILEEELWEVVECRWVVWEVKV